MVIALLVLSFSSDSSRGLYDFLSGSAFKSTLRLHIRIYEMILIFDMGPEKDFSVKCPISE